MILDYATAARYLKIYHTYKESQPALQEAFSPNQIDSKTWLIDEICKIKELNDEDKALNIEIIGSWFGWPFVDMLYHSLWEIEKISMWDIDPCARKICRNYALLFNQENMVEVIGKDYWTHERKGSEAQLIINTSSEHMKYGFEQLKMYKDPFFVNDPVIVVQNNNMFHVKDHIACVGSEDELVERCNFREVLYQGTQTINDLSADRNERYMVIGKLQ